MPAILAGKSVVLYKSCALLTRIVRMQLGILAVCNLYLTSSIHEWIYLMSIFKTNNKSTLVWQFLNKLLNLFYCFFMFIVRHTLCVIFAKPVNWPSGTFGRGERSRTVSLITPNHNVIEVILEDRNRIICNKFDK